MHFKTLDLKVKIQCERRQMRLVRRARSLHCCINEEHRTHAHVFEQTPLAALTPSSFGFPNNSSSETG